MKGGNEENEEDEEVETALDEDDMMNGMNWVQNKGKEIDVNEKSELLNRHFGKRIYEARNIGYFLEDVVLMTDESVSNPRFVKYLIETQDFEIRKTLNGSGSVTNYEVSYYGEPYFNENDVKVRPYRKFKTNDNVIADQDEFNQIRDDMRYHYDNCRKLDRNKILRKEGIATAIGLSLVTLITGLSLGLKRGGSDIKSSAVIKKKKAEKLTPAERRKVIPWIG